MWLSWFSQHSLIYVSEISAIVVYCNWSNSGTSNRLLNSQARLNVGRFSASVETSMSESSASRSGLWRQRLQRLRTRVGRTAPFASGVLAALVAILLYGMLFP